MSNEKVEFSLFGGGFDTGNLGVGALTRSFADSLTSRVSGSTLNIFDHTHGTRREGQIRYLGARWSKRLYQADNINQMRMLLKVGGLWNEGAKAFLRSRAIFDISGGDSFSDLYGAYRYKYIIMPKDMAINAGVPLILLPQTYGPFETTEARNAAQRVVQNAAVAWARDEHSYAVLKELLGDSYDPDRHRCGVDVAFALTRQEPNDVPATIARWFDEDEPVIGLNVSGLIYNQGERAREQYSLGFEYAPAVKDLAEQLLASDSSAKLLLVPHVAPPNPESPESDERACRALKRELGESLQSRVEVAPAFDDPRLAKWLISQCDWFCGTRMHATIAGLSSGVPTGTLAYSGKAQGVFESCGQGDHVADMRNTTAADAIACMMDSWNTRRAAGTSLSTHLPAVLAQAEAQMDHIAGAALGEPIAEPARVPEESAA